MSPKFERCIFISIRRRDALPDEAKAAVYARLWAVLSGAAPGPRYARLTAADRTAIIEILRDTKADLPAYFRGGAVR